MKNQAEQQLIIEPIRSHQSIYQLFEQVEQQPYAMLLDSGSAGRFHIMLWSPAWVVSAKADSVWVEDRHNNRVEHSDVAPLACVDALMHQHLPVSHLTTNDTQLYNMLPFLVGAAGLCGYDLGRFYEALPATNADEYDCLDMAIGIFEQSVIADSRTGALYHCRLSHLPGLATQLKGITSQVQPPFALNSAWSSNMTQKVYTGALAGIHKYIVAGDCYQINMAQRFSAHYSGSEWQAYQALQLENNTPFSAFMRLPTGCVLSISPERFISVKQNKVQTKPIKGTRPRFSVPDEDEQSARDLLAATKDRAENLMIVDLLRNDLSKHCKAHSVNVPHLFALESYAAVHHLVSTIEGELKDDASPLDLLAGAFPGGSITGAPKVRAMEIIEELEPNRRNIYCGSFMYYGVKRDMDSSITIRTLLAENGQLFCWAGGGIVLDSNAEAEYQETLDKVSRILPVLDKYRA
ncbi:aminodeoxychorismate synthase component I [Salinimonas chungwhensis]|uniref:aminodeoxychorismate synthase component I n=1 Tax=Salinimonas chungwhensis TaxID=265425 RepID=UPI00035E7144|nr:aminodeoxychorismate synthase component I [Salinimonas chungwhensis]